VNVERISRYISIKPGVSEAQGAERRVLLSLPRVRWLERQPDYKPWPALQESKPEPVPDYQPTKHSFRPQLRSDELSERQKQAWALYLEGLSVKQVGEKMGISSNAASKLLAQAREKQGIGLD